MKQVFVKRVTLAIATAALLAPLIPSSTATDVEEARDSKYHLVSLAGFLNAVPESRPMGDDVTTMGASCGVEGECNYTTCPQPTCEGGSTASCSCTTSGGSCGPFWDKRPTYNCSCKCGSTDVDDDPKPKCKYVLGQPVVCEDPQELKI